MSLPRFFFPRLAFAAGLSSCGLLSFAGSVWEPVPWVTKAARDAGLSGGEGGQWPQAIAADTGSGEVMLMGTDVGGIYRSSDSGRSWTPSNQGMKTRGVSDFAFDPANPSRVLLVSGNSLEAPFHGLYLSEDAGLTWKNVQPYGNKGYRDFRRQIAFDASSAKDGRSLIAYWSSQNTSKRKGALFKSVDGGLTWSELPASETFGQSNLRVSPGSQELYVSNERGFHVSRDGGVTFKTTLAGPVTAIDISASAPRSVIALKDGQVWISNDRGTTFKASAGKLPLNQGKPAALRLAVSPADPRRMLVDNDEGSWKHTRYVTHDGGATWTKTAFDREGMKPFMLPNNNRQMVAAWHPRDPARVWTFGGDFITGSKDGRLTFGYPNDGYTGFMVGGSFNFNVHNPDILAPVGRAGHAHRRAGEQVVPRIAQDARSRVVEKSAFERRVPNAFGVARTVVVRRGEERDGRMVGHGRGAQA